ncbi:MAG: DNA primase [Pseudomonadota bacterium]
MANRIPQAFIDELLARTDLVELIGRRVQLQRAGHEHKGRCPFHEEKTPSFYVSPVKQFYHCFGCSAHGTAIDFLMQHDHMGFLDAIDELAARTGLEVPRDANGRDDGPSQALYDLTAEAMNWYRKQLERSPNAKAYLSARSVDDTTAETYLLGYAPDAWDGALRQLGTDDGRRQLLTDAGLTITRESDGGGPARRYDRFRDRLMFPIRDVRGRVIGFGGRVLQKDRKDAKYLNSPETQLFHKGRELYGMYEMRRALRSIPRIVVVEGYMDVIALHQHGVAYAVATLGTSTTADHLTRLFRVSDEVVFCFDGDRAGRQAAWRALNNALSEVREGRQLRFLFLPDGEDPDSLVRQEGKEAFETRLRDQALPLSKFLIHHLSEGLDLTTVDDRARLAELARPLIGRVPEGVYRELLQQALAEEVGLTPDRLATHLPSADSTGPRDESNPLRRASAPPRRRQSGQRDTLVRRALRLVLNYPVIAADAGDVGALATLPVPGASLLAEVIEVARSNPDITTATLVERWRDEEAGRHLTALAAQRVLLEDDASRQVVGDVTTAATTDFLDTLAKIAAEGRQRRAAQLLQRPAEQLTSEEKRELQDLLKA